MNGAIWTILGGSSIAPPFVPAPRYFTGVNMCGTRVKGIAVAPTGAADPECVLSWFYPWYGPSDRAKIRAAWKTAKGVDVVLDWAYARSIGYTPQTFAAICRELAADGFRPCPFLCSKDYDPHNDVPGILANIQPVIQPLIDSHIVPRVCIGFELGIDFWINAVEIQHLINAIAPQFVPYGIKVYVHFQSRYYSFPQGDGDNAAFWNLQVGKLTGILAQMPEYNEAATRDWCNDCLERSAGYDGMPAVLIDDHGVDFIACEITANRQFDGEMTEAQGNAFGQYLIDTPPRIGPAGTARVLGSGNGFEVAA